MMSTRYLVYGTILFLFAFPIFAADVPATVDMPQFKVGDRWVYQELNLWTNETKYKVENVIQSVEGTNAVWKYTYLASSDPSIVVGSGGTARYVVSAQSVWRSDLMDGIFENVRFPLEEGKTWKHSLMRRYQEGDVIKGEFTAKAVKWEDVTVPAGRFRAMRIEHSGYWTRPEKNARGSEEHTVWYAPDVKRLVKATHLSHNSNGSPAQKTEQQLVEYQLVKE